jgi:hypothetical protein
MEDDSSQVYRPMDNIAFLAIGDWAKVGGGELNLHLGTGKLEYLFL